MDPRLVDPEGLEVGLFAMTLGAYRSSRARAAFELVGAQIPQRGVQRRVLYHDSRYSKMVMRASAWVWNERWSMTSHSSVAKKLSAIALS